MTHRLRAGIVGPGFIGTVHARAVLAAGGVLTRVAASTPEQAASAAERLLIEHAAASAEELITADDVDVVHICTPNFTHAPLAVLAIRAGKHVVCEKPLATTPADARQAFTPEIEEIARAVSMWRPVAASGDALVEDGLRFLRGELGARGVTFAAGGATAGSRSERREVLR
jgi:predicted dehydrogenase